MNQGGLDSNQNYIGSHDEPWCDFVVLLGQNRDSDIATQSNFTSALEMLGGESKHVHVERFGHWGCGWFELLLVNPKHKKSITKAFEIHKGLEEYGLVDEDDYSERQSAYFSEFATDHKTETAKAFAKHFKVPLTKRLINIAYDCQMEAQHQNGEDACINVYECREPDEVDVKRLVEALEGIQYNYKKSRTFKTLWNSIAVFRLRFLPKAGAL